MALEAVTQYVIGTMRCYYAVSSIDDTEFTKALQEGALHCHADLRRRGDEDPDSVGMATTLTLFLGVWPKAYLLQVGDSRCYIYRNGELRQLTRDQTMAQELIDLGVLTGARGGADPAGPHPLELARRPSIRARRHPARHDLGHRRAALQRRPHDPRAGRPHPGAAPHDD